MTRPTRLRSACSQRQDLATVLSAGRLPGTFMLLLAILMTGCHATKTPPNPGVAASTPGSPAGLLASLAVVPQPRTDPSYRRVAFGPAWTDYDGNGCRQRVDVLARTVDHSRPYTEVRRGRCEHDVLDGTWRDPYTGQAMTFTNIKDPRQAQQIPVDHVVALASAWRYGARHWTAERRLQFATDLDNLQPTSRTVNSAKSDSDAAGWRPQRQFQCAYASHYIAVKVEYSLPVDRSEKAALRQMLDSCAGQR